MTQIACSPDLSSFYGFWMRILLLLLFFLLLAGWFIYLFWEKKGGGGGVGVGGFFIDMSIIISFLLLGC